MSTTHQKQHAPVTAFTPPYSQESEEAVIGAVMVSPELFTQARAIVQPDDFFILRHQYIWRALTRIVDRQSPVDYIILIRELQDMGKLADIGGAAYLTGLLNSAPNSYHAPAYAHMIKRYAVRRQLLAASDQARALALDTEIPVEQINERIEALYQGITSQDLLHTEISFQDLVKEQFDTTEKLMNARKNGVAITGLSTGLVDLDNLLGGLQKTDLIISAGRPGMGKSALATTIAINALKAGKRVGLFSLEMGKTQVFQRMAAQYGRIDLAHLRNGDMSEKDWDNYVNAAGAMYNWNFHLDDTAGLTVPAFKNWVQRWTDAYGRMDLIIVDYLQLMRGGEGFKQNNNDGSREREVSFISEELKAVAKTYDVPVLALAQLNRGVESRADKRPGMADLRESGAIEQNADIILFLYRDEVYNPNTESPNEAELIVAKHRNGATGTKFAYFEKQCALFLNAKKHHVDMGSTK